MNSEQLTLNANILVDQLKKSPSAFTREDIIQFVKNNNIRLINFMYPGGDGRLKTLNFVVSDLAYLRSILTTGERVDGSSLFDFIHAGSSDLYVVPRYSSAFLDPFSEMPTLCLLCSFFDRAGQPLASSPEYTLTKALQAFRNTTGLEFEAMGELEYYVIQPADETFAARDQRGYHESAPYAKMSAFRQRCMSYIAQTGGHIKYGHTEVGCFVQDGLLYEQNEIEFLPMPAQMAADELVIAKWVIRNLAWEEGLNVTFAPKITEGKAGSGFHIHMRFMDNGHNVLLDHGQLSDAGRKAIAGLMDLAPSLTAFGNKIPTSYFRLVPHQEAPTNVCWGMSNRSALVRIPLGWTSGVDMSQVANPHEQEVPLEERGSAKQTFEIRSGDGSADVYQYMAALCVACRHGFEMPDALEVADRTFTDGDINDAANAARLATLTQLPDSCAASADCLQQQRHIYEAQGIFDTGMTDAIIRQLQAYGDRTLRQDLHGDKHRTMQLVKRYFQC
jgi:glutamine synthetase